VLQPGRLPVGVVLSEPGASQAGVAQRRKSVQRSRRSIAAATLTITRLQKTMICARSRLPLAFPQ
jgi:hypothetical protein